MVIAAISFIVQLVGGAIALNIYYSVKVKFTMLSAAFEFFFSMLINFWIYHGIKRYKDFAERNNYP